MIGDIVGLDSGTKEDLKVAIRMNSITSFAYHYKNWLHISLYPEILGYKN